MSRCTQRRGLFGVDEEGLNWPYPFVRGHVPAAHFGLSRGACTGTGVAAIQDHDDMRTGGGDLGEQLGEFLVGQVPAAGFGQPAVPADEGLVQAIRFQVPELRRRGRLRAVATVVEERHVLGAGLAQVLAEAVDEPWRVAWASVSTRGWKGWGWPATGASRSRSIVSTRRMSLAQPRSGLTGAG